MPADLHPKIVHHDREMGVIALSKLVPRFAPLAGLAVELQLGARVWQPFGTAARVIGPLDDWRAELVRRHPLGPLPPQLKF